MLRLALLLSVVQVIRAKNITQTVLDPVNKEHDGNAIDLGKRPFANIGAFEGGPTGTEADTKINNVIGVDDQKDNGHYDIPSGKKPSPLFGVQPFTSKFMRFEEFGRSYTTGDNMDESSDPYGRKPGSNGSPALAALADDFSSCTSTKYLPEPSSTNGYPDVDALDRFLGCPIFPKPTRESNTDGETNPWKALIEKYLGRGLKNAPMDGRPGGAAWAHQQWNELAPENFVETVQTGARTNSGLRDVRQSHRYLSHEFGPGGLYYDTTTDPTRATDGDCFLSGGQGCAFAGTTANLEPKFHYRLPVQKPSASWTFDGSFPPKLMMARYGEPVLFRHHNALPVDVTENNGFGVHTITTHEHNGHTPAESDGFTSAFYFPGQYYDYRWPMALAGRDSINTDAGDPRAGGPDGKGGVRQISGDYREIMSTHWFHDHMLDFTAQNVYKGSVAMMNYYSSIDRGNEEIDDGINLRFPSGTYLDWGNRDYDINVMMTDKAWDDEGQLWFNPHNLDGFIGDRLTVNFVYTPVLEVRARRYRFRILDASVSRYFKVAVITESGLPVPLYMIANDGNVMEHSVFFPDGVLPTQGIGERYDIIIDFAAYAEGTKIYFVNMLAHRNGLVVDRVVDLADIVDGSYSSKIDSYGNYSGDPVVGRFMELRVRAYDGVDKSMHPGDFTEKAGRVMIPIRRPSEEELTHAKHRTFEFERSSDEHAEIPWAIATDGGDAVSMDPRRVSAAPEMGDTKGNVEVWRLVNSGTWSHPIHIHFEEGIILRRDGKPPPPWEKWARKDVYRIGPQPESGVMVEIAYRFRDFSGTFMAHCHNTQHEDHALLFRWDVEHPGQLQSFLAPIPTWDGVVFESSVALPTAKSGETPGGEWGPDLDPVNVWLEGAEVGGVDLATTPLGTALNPTDDERGWIRIPLRKGTASDSEGNVRQVYFVLHDISDEVLAKEFGVAWAEALKDTPMAAMARATYDPSTEDWHFDGDLPNPVTRKTTPTPPQSHNNTYSALRLVRLGGKEVVVNAFFVQWGSETWEHLQVDSTCDFPDDPPNTACMYIGRQLGINSGQVLEIDVESTRPSVVFKTHKSWTHEGDWMPYYIVSDAFPAGPANDFGIIYSPKNQYLGQVAKPLLQFVPPEPLNPSFPPSAADGRAIRGGGPLGGQIGLPSYFMPGVDYSPMWHIGFIHWNKNQTEIIMSIERSVELQRLGELTIDEFPAVKEFYTNNYDFESESPRHVVNCPTPVTVDGMILDARAKQDRAKQEATTAAPTGDHFNFNGASSASLAPLAFILAIVW